MQDCGECVECCYAFKVEDWKEACEECKYEDKGCSIYEDRPQVCKDYECAWLGQPNGHKPLRPDKCGAIFTKMPDNVIFVSVLNKMTYLIHLQIEDFKKQGYRIEYDSTKLHRRPE